MREIRQIVLASVNNVPIRVDDVVEGGPLRLGDPAGKQGVVVGFQSRLGRVFISKPVRNEAGEETDDADGVRQWTDENDVVQGIVLLRKGEASLPALKDVHE